MPDLAPSLSPCAPTGIRSGVWLAVSFGGGVNSAAMLVGLRDKGIRPDRIAFADTGGELPETYEFVESFSALMQTWGFPALVRVAKQYRKKPDTLEAQCRRSRTLPGLAFGTRSCSLKNKGEVLDADLMRWAKENGVPLPVRKAIGYDASEPHRAKKKSPKPDQWEAWYPLIEWGWDRAKCVAVLAAEGLSPAKSACFFCPAMKKWEVLEMARTHPDLMKRALQMEALASETTDRGLGASWKWGDLLANDEAQSKFEFWKQNEERNPFLPCGCMDG